MRKKAKQLIHKLRLEGLLRELFDTRSRLVSHVNGKLGRNKRIVERYLSAHQTRKLHLGCGEHRLDGWLNSDIFARHPEVLDLDASAPFPLASEQFDYIFSEHMIEHIPYAQGSLMLSECYRILRKDGTLRISTPDLALLIDLYKEDKSELQKAYVKWAIDVHVKSAPYYDGIFVINNFVRDWGHQFIYDERTLTASLKKAGFRSVTRCTLNASNKEPLRNLENEDRMPKGFMSLETITVEATK